MTTRRGAEDSLPAYWWRDKDTLLAQQQKYGTLAGAARAIGGVSYSTLANWWKQHGLPKLSTGHPPVVRVRDPEAEVSQEEMLRQRVRELEGAVSTGRKEDVLRERMIAALKVELRSKQPTYKPRPLARRSEREEHEMALLWSDTHAGEIVSREETNGLNAYDWQEMMRRHDEILRGVLSYVENRPYPIRRLHVWALGDMLSGAIHDELAETNEFPLIESAVQFGLDAAEWLERFVPEFKEIRFAGVVGNHPRMHHKPRAKQRYDNLDWLTFHTMQQRLRKYESVSWEIPKAQKWPIEICGRRALLSHGDGVRSNMVGFPAGGLVRHVARLGNEYSRAGMPIDHFIFGHFHTAQVLENRRIIVNGSVKGLDEWALQTFGQGEPGHQLLLTFHPKRGLTDISALDLQ